LTRHRKNKTGRWQLNRLLDRGRRGRTAAEAISLAQEN
jgi:hypothetical protein